MKKIVLLCLLGVLPCALSAQERDMGAGLVIGDPVGISGKMWLSRRNAVDGAFSVVSGNKLYLHGDYLWHDYAAFPEPEEGKLPLYYGVGARIISDGQFGVRGVIGIEYIFDGYPFDLFLELAPVLDIAEDAGLRFTGGFGGRYFFGAGTAKKKRSR